MANGNLVADRRRVGATHHVHDTPVLNIRTSTNHDTVDVSSQNGVHPNAAVVADDLGTMIDEGGRRNTRVDGPVRPEHSEDYTRGCRAAFQLDCTFTTNARRTRLETRTRGKTAVRLRRRRRSPRGARPHGAQRAGDVSDTVSVIIHSMTPSPLSDRLGRPLRSLRVSVTDRCNLRCQYCMPETDYVWLPRRDILTYEETGVLVDVFAGLGVDRVRITGGEPLLRRDLPDLVTLLAAKGPIQDLALTTNGILLADQAAALGSAGLHRITVSLDTLRPDRFEALTRSDELDAVLRGLEEATRLWHHQVKIDTVVIRAMNDDELLDLLDYGRDLGAEVRFIEYMDVGGATRWSLDDVVPRAEILRIIESRNGAAAPVEEQTSAPADRYTLADGTMFGIISSTTEPFCRSCDRSRLTADGLWYLCLYAQTGTDLRGPLREGASAGDLQELITSTWTGRDDRGAESRLALGNRQPLVPVETLQKRPHLEMHTRGG